MLDGGSVGCRRVPRGDGPGTVRGWDHSGSVGPSYAANHGAQDQRDPRRGAGAHPRDRVKRPNISDSGGDLSAVVDEIETRVTNWNRSRNVFSSSQARATENASG